MEIENHSSMRKLKNAGLKVPWAKELRSMKNGFKRDDRHPSWQMAIQTHIDAANALVQLANEDPSLLDNGLCSHQMKHGAKVTPSIKDLRAKSRGDRNSDDSHSEVAGRKVNLFVNSQQAAFGGQMKDKGGVVLALPAMPYPARRMKKKIRMFKKLSSLQPKCIKNNDSEKDDNLYESCQLMDGRELTNRWGNSGEKPTEVCLEDCHNRLGMSTTKQKMVAELNLKRETVEVASPVKIPVKMQGFNWAVPTVHTTFSFSVIYLLTAVRRAMIALHTEDDAVVYRNDQAESDTNGMDGFYSLKDEGISDSVLINSKILPSLTLNQIVERVRSTPMDPCILQTQEPLQDLIIGVLEIFSSKTAPWEPIAFYHKSSKCWSCIGPITFNSCSADEEDVSSEAWSLPHDVLEKLVESFAIWYKNFQERLHQVGSVPAPPLVLMQPTPDESERLGDVSCQKHTVTPSSEEVRDRFHKEEALRYLVADRAFSYTAVDGRKSAVAPLSRRPAARLPGSCGTKADISTLLQDSQYIAEEVSDEQLGPAVKGALSQLSYEYDPCVKFDRDRNLWVYLHAIRREEDFEDGGTLSTIRRPNGKVGLSNLSAHETALKDGQEETCML